MKVLLRHKTPFTRQIQEATEIELSRTQYLINSKGEFNSARIPRVTVEVGDRAVVREYRGAERTDTDSVSGTICKPNTRKSAAGSSSLTRPGSVSHLQHDPSPRNRFAPDREGIVNIENDELDPVPAARIQEIMSWEIEVRSRARTKMVVVGVDPGPVEDPYSG